MIYVIFAVACIATTFVFNKLYQLKYCKGIEGLLLFPIVSSVLGWIFYFVLNGFQLHFAGITFLFAFLYAVVSTFNNIVGLIIMKHCKMSLYMSFLMIGGMFLPFLYGVIFLSEVFTLWRGVGIVLLILAILLPTFEKSEEKVSKLGILLCFGVFICNGLLNIFSKVHQINQNALNTNDFMMWVYLFSIVFAVAIYCIYQATQKKIEEESVAVSATEQGKDRKRLLCGILLLALISIISAIGTLFNLTGAKTVDAAMLYPMTTGGTIVLTSIAGWTIYREKANTYAIVGIIVALIGTILFAF